MASASKEQILAGASDEVYVTPKGLEEAGVFADFTGSSHWFATQTAPAGFIKANGAAISRTDYASLFD
ncbi:tail fiber protein, partial [Marinomonas agarivorans]